MVVPTEDWKKLKNEKISVQEYVDNSVWSFGYYWGGGSMLRGVQWQPLEEKGIHDTERIKRYLTILNCRTNRISSGYMPNRERCISCFIEQCPFSPWNAKSEGASWNNEVKEYDDRILFFKAVKQRIKKQFDLDAVECYNQDENTICMFPGYNQDKVNVYLPEKILIDMMYNPNMYNIEEIANNLEIHIGIPCHYDENDKFVPEKRYNTTSETGIQQCYDYWKKECPMSVETWFDTEIVKQEEEKNVETIKLSKKNNHTFAERFVNLLKKLF